MRKMATNRTRGRWRWLASLAVMLIAFGCASNRYPGSGEPTVVTPSYGAVSPALTPGSSYGTAGIPPMASSYRGTPRVNVDALATLAADQGFEERVLGPIGAEGPQSGSGLTPTGGQFVNPALIVNPQPTVNASISSPGNPAITGGTAGGGAALFAAPAITAFSPTVSGAAVFQPRVINSTITGTTQSAAAAAAATSPLTATGTVGVGAPLPAGVTVPSTTAFSPTIGGNLTFNPVMASSVVPGTTFAAPTAATTLRTAQRPVSTARTSTVSAPLMVTTTNQPVRIATGANGRILITNLKK